MVQVLSTKEAIPIQPTECSTRRSLYFHYIHPSLVNSYFCVFPSRYHFFFTLDSTTRCQLCHKKSDIESLGLNASAGNKVTLRISFFTSAAQLQAGFLYLRVTESHIHRKPPSPPPPPHVQCMWHIVRKHFV